MFGGSEININFPTGIPDHLTYQTAFVDDAGKLQIRDDVYGRDARLLAILKGSDRKVADIAIDRPRAVSSAPVKMPPGTFGSAGGGVRRTVVLRAAVRRHARAGAQAARARRRQRAPRSHRARPSSADISRHSAAAHRCGRIVFRALSAGHERMLPMEIDLPEVRGRGDGRLRPLRKGAGDQ